SATTSIPTASRGPGTAQYIRIADTATAPAPAVITAAAGVQYRPVSRTSSHTPATAVTAARNPCGAPGLAPGGTVPAVRAASVIAVHAAPSPTTRKAPRHVASKAIPTDSTVVPPSTAST